MEMFFFQNKYLY